MSIVAIVRALVAAKATPEMILAAVEAAENERGDALEKRRQNDRDRQARKRSHVTSRDVTVTVSSHASVTPVEDNLQTKNSTGKQEKKDISHSVEFESEIWPAYPRKVGKAAALKAYLAARKRASFETILAGVRRYAAERAGQESQFTKHPQGWLNGDHWGDEPTPVVQPRSGSPHRREGVVEALGEILETRRNGHRNEAQGDYPDVECLPPDGRQLSRIAGHLRASINPAFDGGD